MDYVPGQRWISTTEPELGLATVLRADARGVQMLFARSGVLRQYARESAPFVRAEFRIGQRISGKGRSLTIERVELREGLLLYTGDGLSMQEGELDDEQAVSQADERLMAGRVDGPQAFTMRVQALQRRQQARAGAAWGLASARIALLPHQLRVAEAADGRLAPRLLLADEAGLGKTIEAGMVIARLLASGRAARVLVLLPETLLAQWFVELLRRFNLEFALFDEERCEAIEAAGDARNPFADEQCVLAPLPWLAERPARQEQLLDAGWDLLVVDEAHHLEWTPDHASPGYTLVERLAVRVPALLLLTATPEQLGREAHFARLRLLDPARYARLDDYLAESADYAARSALAQRIETGAPLDTGQRERLQALLRGEPQAGDWLAAYPDPAATGALLDALIDRHGTGRVMFRHHRDGIGGFAPRVPDLETGPPPPDEHARQRLMTECLADLEPRPPAQPFDDSRDARLPWLTDLLETHPQEKFLLLCRSEAKVLALEEALRMRTGAGVTRFTESMGLVQRDRAAAWFAAPDGARLLLCSEIGSEGRNFQFAHHLVLWDLPLDPDLLEQRIGRLDRIGQTRPVHIHYRAHAGSAQHALARWHHEGVDAFRATPADGRALLRRFGGTLRELVLAHARGGGDRDQEFEALLAETRAAHADLSAAIAHGRDRLLELAAQRAAPQQALLRALQAADRDADLRDFVLRLLELYGVHSEDGRDGSVLLDPEYMTTDALTALRQGPLRATFDRTLALAREELALLRMDHPLLQGAVDLLLGSELGNASFVVDDTLPARSAVLEAVYLLECVAAPALDAPRYLPPTPLPVAVDSRLQPREDFAPSPAALRRAAEKPLDLGRHRAMLGRLVPPMLARARELADVRARALTADARARMHAALERECGRLEALARINGGVCADEIDRLRRRRAALDAALSGARLRLDAVRFTVSPDVLALRPARATA